MEPRSGDAGAEVLWDVHGVPHVFAPDTASLFHAFGWAQMRCRADLLLRLYGQARGRAAEFWGEAHLASDMWVASMGVPERAREWLAVQSPAFRGCLEAFAAGINDFARRHPGQVSEPMRAVLPVDAADVLAHAHRVLHFSFVVDLAGVGDLVRTGRPAGSNAWGIGADKSATGNAILLCNPHLLWGDAFLCVEAHLHAPGVDAYGIALVGFPVLAMAFNPALGWAHTVNAHKGWTLYELEPVEGGGYLLDGEVRDFASEEMTLLVRERDGTLGARELTVRRSVHGPVVAADGRLFAVRVAGLDRPRSLEQWWRMARAHDLAGFEAALAELQVPMFTVVYADRDGHIMHLFNGQVPVRAEGDAAFWAGIVPGSTSSSLWTDYHPYADLPRVVDPPGGWVHSANDPPWTCTVPQVARPEEHPPYLAPRGPVGLRAQRSAQMLAKSGRLSLEDVAALRFCTRVELADRVLDDLVAAAARSDDAVAGAAAEVLRAWDRRTDAASRGAVLFVLWARAMDPAAMFAEPWDERLSLETPRGLGSPDDAVAVLAAVAARVAERYGALDVPWGEVFRLGEGPGGFPAVGADGVGSFTELWFVAGADDRYTPFGGDCYTAVVEFSDPVRALVLTTYGNGGERGAELGREALEMFSRKKLRPALLARAEIENRLHSRERPLRAPPAPARPSPPASPHAPA